MFLTSWDKSCTLLYQKMICLSKGFFSSASAYLVVVSFSNSLFLLPTFGVVAQASGRKPSLVVDLLGRGACVCFCLSCPTSPHLPQTTIFPCSSERTQWPSEQLFPVNQPSGNWVRAPTRCAAWCCRGRWADRAPTSLLSSPPHAWRGALDPLSLTVQDQLLHAPRRLGR